jgi:hypothetical protein
MCCIDELLLANGGHVVNIGSLASKLVVPAKTRWQFALAQLSPRLGDWLLLRSGIKSPESRAGKRVDG